MTLIPLLDRCQDFFDDGRVFDGMATLTPQLTDICRASTPEEWKDVLIPSMYEHRIFESLQQDPFTSHAHDRPRGYPGDAALIDLIYDPQHFPNDASNVGQQIARYSLNVPETVAVRERRVLLATIVDEVCHSCENPEVLCVASGHCRELELSHGFARRLLRRRSFCRF